MNETFWILGCALVALVSMMLTGILIPQILLIAFRRNLFDGVDSRKIHHGSVPRLGGIAFVPSILLSLAFIMGCFIMVMGTDILELVTVSQPVAICFGVCALMLLYLVGMADDLIGVKYRAKFMIQVLASVLVVVSGMSITNLDGFLGIYKIHWWASSALTILVMVFIINAINLIDGIDGLASGLSAIALLCYGSMFFIMEHYFIAMLAFATLGCLVPFFYFNVMGDAIKKKKIFMGDTGSLTIGFILAFLSVEMCNTASETVVNVDPVVLAFSPILLSCFDVVRVFVHRLRNRQNPFLPDRCHIHHKLLAFGLPQRIVMILILLWSLAYAIVSVYLSKVMNITFVLLIDFGSWVLINYLLSKAIIARRQRHPKLEHQYV